MPHLAPTADAQQSNVTRLARLITLAGCVKPKLLGEAKAALAEPSSHAVEFRAHVRGQVTKGLSTPSSSVSQAPVVDVFTRGVVVAALRKLKVTPAKLRAAVKAAAMEGWGLTPKKSLDDCADLVAVFDQVSADISGELPATTIQTAGRAAAVRVEATFDLLD